MDTQSGYYCPPRQIDYFGIYPSFIALSFCDQFLVIIIYTKFSPKYYYADLWVEKIMAPQDRFRWKSHGFEDRASFENK